MDLLTILVADDVSRRGSRIRSQDHSVFVNDADDCRSSLGGLWRLEAALIKRFISVKSSKKREFVVVVSGYG